MLHRFTTAAVAVLATCLVGLALTNPAAASPARADSVAHELIAAGVPAGVVGQASLVPAADPGVVHITHPGGGHLGSSVDAVIDHAGKNITVIQRWNSEPSRLSVGWVNLATGASGISGFPTKLARPDLGPNYYDWATTLPTGSGQVALVVWGAIPGWIGLIPAAPEYFGILTPGGTLVTV